MRRAGGMMERIADPANLRLAFWRATLGKRDREVVRSFSARLEDELSAMRNELIEGRVVLGPSRAFSIRDPKPRTIHAPAFRDRVLHHALMNVCEPVFDRGLIDDTYACRRGRGRLAAIRRAEAYTRRFGWFLKLDVRKYFDSIDHDVLLARLGRKFREERLLEVFEAIVDHHHFAPGKGLPIGALTSQHFANDYLSPVDRLIKETLKVGGYVRYMDDMVLWSRDRGHLIECERRMGSFLGAHLNLEFKPTPYLNRTGHGLDFLGYRLWPGRTALRKEAVRRLRRRFTGCQRAWESGVLSDRALQDRVTAFVAFADGTGDPAQRARIFGDRGFGARSERGEPGPPRRELGEPCEEPPVLVSQRQPPVESERQPGLSSFPSSDSSVDDRSPTRFASSPSPNPSAMAKSVALAGVGSGDGVSAKAPAGANFAADGRMASSSSVFGTSAGRGCGISRVSLSGDSGQLTGSMA